MVASVLPLSNRCDWPSRNCALVPTKYVSHSIRQPALAVALPRPMLNNPTRGSARFSGVSAGGGDAIEPRVALICGRFAVGGSVGDGHPATEACGNQMDLGFRAPKLQARDEERQQQPHGASRRQRTLRRSSVAPDRASERPRPPRVNALLLIRVFRNVAARARITAAVTQRHGCRAGTARISAGDPGVAGAGGADVTRRSG